MPTSFRNGLPARAWTRRTLAGAVIVCLVVLVAIFAPLLTPHDPGLPSSEDFLTPPFWIEGGTISHPLGTDIYARDIWSRLVYGARTSLIVALGALALGGVLGTTIGFLSAYYRGSRDRILDTDLPRLISPVVWLVCCVFVAVWLVTWLVIVTGPGLITLIIALGLVTSLRYVKPIRMEVMRYGTVEADHPVDEGAMPPHFRSSVRSLLPRVAGLLPALFVSQMGFLIILESVLSFLGVGVPPPTSSWGGAVSDVRLHLITAWWLSAFPLICIALVSAGFYMTGDWLSERHRNSLAAP